MKLVVCIRLVFSKLLLAIFLVGWIFTPAMSEDDVGSNVIEGRDGWLFAGWESLTTANTVGVDQCISLIRQVKDQLAAKKIELIVFVAPLKASVYQRYLPEGQPISREVLARYEHILSKMNLEGILTTDLRLILNQVEADRKSVFYKSDYHWTAWASEATAVGVAKEIRERWKLSGKDRTGMTLGSWVSETRFGDLANFLPSDHRRKIGEEVFAVRQIAAKGNLLDETSGPVRVIGNSFVQPYLGFTQRLSHELDRPVGLTWNYGNVGPWITFLQFIQSSEFKNARPQVIVWQFNEGQFMNGPNAPGQWDASSNMAPDLWLERLKTSLSNLAN